MAKKLVIFDFDGTIADTLDLIKEISNDLSDELGYKKLNYKDVKKLSDLKTEEIVKIIGISSIKLPFWLKKINKGLNEEIEFAKPFYGIRKALLKIKENGYKLGIITSNSKGNVKKFLRKNNLDLFDFVYSGSSMFGKNKLINKLLKEKKLKPNATVFVGDETRDIEAAKKSKVKIIAVSWGLNSKSILKKQNPDFLIDEPKEIIEILENKLN